MAAKKKAFSWKMVLAITGAILLGKLITFALGGYSGGISADEVARKLEATEQGAIFLTIKSQFPDAYADFTHSVARRASDGAGDDELGQMGFEFTSTLRKENAHLIAGASDATVTSGLRSALKVTEALSADPLLCASYSVNGGAALRGRDEIMDVLPLIGEQSQHTFTAIAEGRAAPALSEAEPTDNDWAEFADFWASQGATAEELELLAAQQTEDPRFCAVSISFIRSVIHMPGEAGQSMRRYLLMAAAQS